MVDKDEGCHVEVVPSQVLQDAAQLFWCTPIEHVHPKHEREPDIQHNHCIAALKPIFKV